MTAKKTAKRATTPTRGERAAMVIDRWATMESELAASRTMLLDLTKQLTARNLVIADHLRAIQKLTEERALDRREYEAEIAYWKGEVDRLHNELIDIHRERARESVS